MSGIINLNKARKARARAEADAKAAENRVAFGRTRAEKEAARAAAERTERTIEAHRREP